MKKTLLWAMIFALSLTLISCAVPDRSPPTTTESTTMETTVASTTLAGGIDCPGAPIESAEPQPTCNTGSVIIPEHFYAPEDEEKTHFTYTVTNEYGLILEVTLDGYKSEMMGEMLYFKSNEPIEIKITLKNETDAPIYQWQPTMCHGMTPSHNHELSILFTDKNGNKLANMNVEYYYTGCPTALEVWNLEAGESYEWNIKYFAGYAKENVIWKDPICDTEFFTTFEHYDSDIYTDGACLFEGTVDFAFGYESNGYENCNNQKLSVPLSLKVFYVGE